MSIIGGIVPGWKVFWNLVGIAAFIIRGIFVYSAFFAPPEGTTSAEENCIEQIKPKITEDVNKFAFNEKNTKELRGFIVADIQNDLIEEEGKDGVYLYHVKQAAKDVDGIVHKDAPISKKLVNYLKNENDEVSLKSKEEMVKYIQETPGVDFVIFGSIKTKNYPEKKQAEMTLNLTYQAEETSFSKNYKAVSWHDGSKSGPGFFSQVGNAIWRILLFAALAFCLPIIAYPINIALMRLDSNALNGFLLVFYTLIAGFLVFLLAEFVFTGWTITFAVIAMIAAGFWNYRVLSITADHAR